MGKRACKTEEMRAHWAEVEGLIREAEKKAKDELKQVEHATSAGWPNIPMRGDAEGQEDQVVAEHVLRDKLQLSVKMRKSMEHVIENHEGDWDEESIVMAVEAETEAHAILLSRSSRASNQINHVEVVGLMEIVVDGATKTFWTSAIHFWYTVFAQRLNGTFHPMADLLYMEEEALRIKLDELFVYVDDAGRKKLIADEVDSYAAVLFQAYVEDIGSHGRDALDMEFEDYVKKYYPVE